MSKKNQRVSFVARIRAPFEAISWLVGKLKGVFDVDNPKWKGAGCAFQGCELDRQLLRVEKSEDRIDESPLIEAVCEMQDIFDLRDPWVLSVVKSGPEQFDEKELGWTVCYKGKHQHISPIKFVNDSVAEFVKAVDIAEGSGVSRRPSDGDEPSQLGKS